MCESAGSECEVEMTFEFDYEAYFKSEFTPIVFSMVCQQYGAFFHVLSCEDGVYTYRLFAKRKDTSRLINHFADVEILSTKSI